MEQYLETIEDQIWEEIAFCRDTKDAVFLPQILLGINISSRLI